MIGEEEMKTLKRNIGERVRVLLVYGDGETEIVEGKLKWFAPYSHITLTESYILGNEASELVQKCREFQRSGREKKIPELVKKSESKFIQRSPDPINFVMKLIEIGWETLTYDMLHIREIQKVATGETIYSNPVITPENLRKMSIEEIVRLSFGEEKAKEYRREKEERERQRLVLEEEAQKALPGLIERGKQIVKPELQEEWERVIKQHFSQNFYYIGIVEIAVLAMEFLKGGKNIDQAVNEALHKTKIADSTGQIAPAFNLILYFYPLLSNKKIEE